ncbi:uncharacterized protein LOC119361128 [Triticum dicoccoides]|uniref:uncharacterized protein LOC119361128 n=1 Tax=Triticum dicoccoides TaxID=85692 RepID=UPI00188E842A|nr:uncharacterized protein LOC119361128 [Triticum dicoccoides]
MPDSAPAPAPPSSTSPEEDQPPATKTPPATLSPETTLATSPLDELLPIVAPPPSPFFDPPYVKAGQVALRCFLGCGNAMGLEFEDDASYYLRLNITTPAIHLASPLYIIFHYSNRRLDATIIAALLQSVLGGAAADFFVAQCSPLVYRFHVASALIAEIILAQSTLRFRAYSLSFLRTLPPIIPSPPNTATCMTLAHLLQIPEDLGLHFESVAWTQCRSLVSQCPPNQPHGCRMYVRVIQFPFTLDAITMSLILVFLFGGTHHQFNVTDDGDSCFFFTVASPAVAALIASMGDFHKLGILLRFPWPMPTGRVSCSPPKTAMPSSNGPKSSSPSADDPALLPPASTSIVLSKERRQRPGISFLYHLDTHECNIRKARRKTERDQFASKDKLRQSARLAGKQASYFPMLAKAVKAKVARLSAVDVDTAIGRAIQEARLHETDAPPASAEDLAAIALLWARTTSSWMPSLAPRMLPLVTTTPHDQPSSPP